jgi:hypothetical protein
MDEENRPRVFDPHGTQQTVPLLKATLPRRVPEWESTSTNRRVLTANDEDEYIEMCRAVLEEKPTYGLLRHLQHQKRTQGACGRGASEAPACCNCGAGPGGGRRTGSPAAFRWPADVATSARRAGRPPGSPPGRSQGVSALCCNRL